MTRTRSALASRSAALGKFTRPRPVGALTRARLFEALDRARRHPAVWVSGPPGAGKTTLVSTHVAQRRLRTVWYRMNEDDADPATFFHYFGLAVDAAAPRRPRASLPHLTPEYGLNLPQFSRRFFEEAYRRLRRPCTLVLDNYQEVPPASALHDVIRELLESLPEGMNLVVLSRAEPPAAFAGLRARGDIAFLGAAELKLTAEECEAIAELRGVRVDAPALRRLHERTQGWTAGVVLALEQRALSDDAAGPPAEATPQVVFDYFAGEIFERMEPAAQSLLLQAAFLPEMAAPRVVRLTGDAQADRILGDFARRNYFTLKLAQVQGAPPAVYQFHPLFREFLLRRAQETLDAATLAEVRQKAAALLEADGETEEAIALLLAAQAWDEAMRLMHVHAQQMLRQGRGRVLESWLRALPPSLGSESPWALYWLGRCRLGYDPSEAREHLEQAFALFERDDDALGQFTAWASIVDTFVFEWGEFSALDRWIAVLDGLLARHRLPTPEIEARVAFGMLVALMYRQPHRADLPRWAERVRAMVARTADGRTQMLLGNQLMHYYTSWVGDMAAARLLRSAVRRPLGAADCGPLAFIAWCSMEADYHWNAGAHDDCLRSMQDGLETTRHTGAHFASSVLDAHGLTDRIMAGDFSTADRFLKRAAGTIHPARVLYLAHYHFLLSLAALYQDDAPQAVASAREAVALADTAGAPLCQALYREGLAHALFAGGERREAMRPLAEARAIARRSAIVTLGAVHFATTAWFLLARGKTARALPWLRKALAMGAKGGEFNRTFWTPRVATRLLCAALENGIEVEPARELIRRRRIAPPADRLPPNTWPYAVRVYTLGRFSVLLDDKPLEFTGKAQRKPLELLMAIVAFGGRDVSERQLTEALWPDAEGDAAHQACAAALHRLRKLLGCEAAIGLQRNHFSLDPRHVWVDAWAFERGLESDRTVELYQGTFLGRQTDLPWAVPLRERLRTKFMRHLAERGRALCAAGDLRAAVALFEKGLAADPLAEDFYRQLMLCYQSLDLRAEAIGVYRRCEQTLATLGVLPGTKTLALYQALRDKPH